VNVPAFDDGSPIHRIAAEIARLPGTFHHDPADRIIVATGRARRIPVITYDERIRRQRLASLWHA
jgi:PIN domain nuclease of toxin-antitoxin system